jgi:hypothetical protein
MRGADSVSAMRQRRVVHAVNPTGTMQDAEAAAHPQQDTTLDRARGGAARRRTSPPGHRHTGSGDRHTSSGHTDGASAAPQSLEASRHR